MHMTAFANKNVINHTQKYCHLFPLFHLTFRHSLRQHLKRLAKQLGQFLNTFQSEYLELLSSSNGAQVSTDQFICTHLCMHSNNILFTTS